MDIFQAPPEGLLAEVATPEEIARFVVAAAVNAPSCITRLLTTSVDHPADWIHAGQALQRVLLLASSGQVAAALHSQPLELPLLRDFIRTHLIDRAYPQMVLRFGATGERAVSVRRPVDEVLTARWD